MTRTWKRIALGNGDLLLEMQPGYACGKKDVVGGVVHLRLNNVTKDGNLDMTLMRRIPREFAKKRGRFAETSDVLFVNTNSTELVGKRPVIDWPGSRCPDVWATNQPASEATANVPMIHAASTRGRRVRVAPPIASCPASIARRTVAARAVYPSRNVW